MVFTQQKLIDILPGRANSTGKLVELLDVPVGVGGFSMTSKKKDVFVMPRKIYWHLYSLQNLNGEKFIRVVDKILRKEYQLIK